MKFISQIIAIRNSFRSPANLNPHLKAVQSYGISFFSQRKLDGREAILVVKHTRRTYSHNVINTWQRFLSIFNVSDGRIAIQENKLHYVLFVFSVSSTCAWPLLESLVQDSSPTQNCKSTASYSGAIKFDKEALWYRLEFLSSTTAQAVVVSIVLVFRRFKKPMESGYERPQLGAS